MGSRGTEMVLRMGEEQRKLLTLSNPVKIRTVTQSLNLLGWSESFIQSRNVTKSDRGKKRIQIADCPPNRIFRKIVDAGHLPNKAVW